MITFDWFVFQLTASQGGWRWTRLCRSGLKRFQLTASQGGWPHRFPSFLRILISTHSLTRRLTEALPVHCLEYSYFNSQPHKEADETFLGKIIDVLISTHSLTRRLTHNLVLRYFCYNISTHSLTRRLTILKHRSHAPSCISTHSLTRRLTTGTKTLLMMVTFQLTASQGGWHIDSVPPAFRKVFQLTASQGGWHGLISNYSL